MDSDLRKGGKFVVTGGAGFIGSHLCRNLLDHRVDPACQFAISNQVVCIDKFSKGKERIFDMTDKFGFEIIPVFNGFLNVNWNMIISERVGCIFHFASYPSPKDHLKMPIETLHADSEGTMAMLQLAKDKDAIFVLASTGHIDQNSDPTDEKGIYSEGKRFAEAYTMAHHRKFGTEVRIVRMFNSYGPGMRVDDGRVVPTFIVKALRGEKLTILGGDQLISLTYIDDMVDGIKRVAYSDINGPVEIGTTDRISVKSLAKGIIELTQSDSQLVSIPSEIKDERIPNLEKADCLGWSPKTGIVEGLERTIEYFRSKNV